MPKRKKSKPTPAPELRLLVDYYEHCSGSDDDENIDVDFLGVFRTRDASAPFFVDSKVVPARVYEAEEVALVVVRYNTGSTFSTTTGAWELLGIYLPDEAKALARAIDADPKNWGTEPIGNSTMRTYQAWQGYFETYVGVEVHTFRVTETCGRHNDSGRIKYVQH